MKEPAVQRGVGEVWWLNPFKLCLFFLIPLYTLIFLIPEVFGPRAVSLKFVIYFTWQYYLIGLMFLLVFANGALIGSIGVVTRQKGFVEPRLFNRYYLDALAILTIFAYLIWFRNLLIDPSVLRAVIFGQSGGVYSVRTANKTIGGVTTLTQLGAAYVIFYLNQIWGAQRPFESRRYAVYLLLILGLAVFRMRVWAERLALIELLVPIAVMYVAYRAPRTGWVRLLMPTLPIAGILGLFVLFGLTEYFRSWETHYQFQHTGFWDFVATRLVSYYYTSLNNGAGMLTVYDWPTWRFENILHWLYRFPLLLGPVIHYVADVPPEESAFFDRYADPEFNNPSGIFMVVRDVGLGGGLAFAALSGVLAGYLWRSLIQRKGIGLFYPICFISLLELFRTLYMTGARAFPTLLALALGYLLLQERPSRAQAKMELRQVDSVKVL